tara:strand:- start:11591 stop:13534 length:1944 start_codon:yes stop_codon:yes gene_type:complete
MQFKNPELLFAFLLLVIPIIVHLFQLRKFQKTPFTNLKFLKEVTLQTRKSSQLKKWLVLLTRLFALACIILAFAQPYSTTKTDAAAQSETVIYIDNSLSLQAKGAQGEMLKTATQQLFKNSNIPEELSWFTNNSSSQKTTTANFKSAILDLSYSSNSLNLRETLLKAESFFSNDQTTIKNLVWISDFQGQENFPDLSNSNLNISTLQMRPSNTNNLVIDSISISGVNSSSLELSVLISNYGEAQENVPIALYKKEALIARTSVEIQKNASATATFEVEDTNFEGTISITDQSLLFDNQFHFNINKKSKIKVLSIHKESDAFLRKIYTSDEFDFTSQQLNQLDFNILQEQNTIILNQLEEINTVLQNALNAFVENGGSLVVIPPEEINLSSYNSFFSQFNLGSISKSSSEEKQITTIHFSHPIYQNVFEGQVTNFQYPKVGRHFLLLPAGRQSSRNHTPVLSFEDNSDFLIQSQNIFVFTGALTTENSNFINSPLVVPTFYRIAKQSLPLPDLYYTIGNQNEFAVPVSLPQDHILSLKNETVDFIPLQRNSSNKVLITTNEQPEEAGIYGVFDKETKLQSVSFNYARSESKLTYMNPANWVGTTNYNSLDAVFEKLAEDSSVREFWKWFVIFALFFLAIEMFLLKLLK